MFIGIYIWKARFEFMILKIPGVLSQNAVGEEA